MQEGPTDLCVPTASGNAILVTTNGGKSAGAKDIFFDCERGKWKYPHGRSGRQELLSYYHRV